MTSIVLSIHTTTTIRIYHDSSFKHNKVLWETIDLSASTPVLEPSPSPSVWTESLEESMGRRRPRCVSYDLLSYCNADEINLWDLHDYSCAGKLLMRPQIVVEFVDEYEMRKVYSLIYDVYRCESWNFKFGNLV
jgi:hypothetical protein